MTLPKIEPARKPRRVFLYAPFAALALAVLAWVGGWSWMRDEVFRHMDQSARTLGESGWRVDWAGRSMSGFPFRLDLEVTAPRVREVSGWGLAAPRLKAEAFVFSADHWIVVAPDGVTLTRRVGGPVSVAAKALRASLSAASDHPPRLSVEGLDLAFAPGPGGAPVAVTSARELHIHTKAGPDDQGAAYFELDAARTDGNGLLAALAAGAPADLTADAIFSHASALSGQGIAGALGGWRAAGGGLTLRQLALRAGRTSAVARSGSLAIGADGRLKGTLDLTLTPAAAFLDTLAVRGALTAEAARAAQAELNAHAQGAGPAGGAAVSLDFQAGQTTLGPVAIGPAPRVY